MRTCLLILLLFLSINLKAQEAQTGAEERPHKVAFVFGYTHIPAGFEEGEPTKSVFVPTIGVDYFYQFEKGWKVGAVLDLELAGYRVTFEGEELPRESALVTGILVGYEFLNKWSILAGPGLELERNRNIAIFRASVEREFELDENWGLFPSFNYYFKKEYSTWSLNVGVSRRF